MIIFNIDMIYDNMICYIIHFKINLSRILFFELYKLISILIYNNHMNSIK